MSSTFQWKKGEHYEKVNPYNCMYFVFPLTLFAQDTMKFVYYNDFAPFSWEDSEKQMGNLGDITLNFLK